MLPRTEATNVSILNPGFEDTTGQVSFNEFTFGPPIAGWDLYDPNVFEVIGTPDSSLVIPEGEFSIATVSATVDETHPYLGNNLGIRLVNLNEIPAGYTQQTSPDLEVDFDAVTLTATSISVPIPASIFLSDPGGLPTLSFQTNSA